MFRKFIEKYYNLIQWTKKWHFFHVLVTIPGISILWAIIYSVLYPLPDSTDSFSIAEMWIYSLFVFIILMLSEYITIFVAIGVELTIIIKRAIARKPFCVLSNFLNNNKIYNFIYCFFFSLIVLTILEFLLVSELIYLSS